MKSSSFVIFIFSLALLVGNGILLSRTGPVLAMWLGNNQHRLPNIRLIPEECRANAVRRFIAVQDWSKPSLVVFGDSQPFSDGIPASNTWPNVANHVALLDMQVINLAVIDGRPADTAYVASLVPRLAAQVAVVNLNQSHGARDSIRRVPERKESVFNSLHCSFVMRRFLLARPPPLPDHENIRENYRRINLQPDRYLDQVDREAVINAVRAVSATSRLTLAFVTPNNVDAFKDYNFDVGAFTSRSAELTSACKASGAARCIDLSTVLGMVSFSDIVHLNTAGSFALGRIVALHLSSQSLQGM